MKYPNKKQDFQLCQDRNWLKKQDFQPCQDSNWLKKQEEYPVGIEKQIYVSHLCQDGELLKLLEKYPVGIESIEFSMGDTLDMGKKGIEAYKKRIPGIEKYPLMLHGPFLDLNPVSYDAQIAKTSKERFCQTIQTAKELNAKGVVFHTSFIPATNFTIGWAKRQIIFWQEMMEQYAGKLKIYLENVFDPEWQPLLEIAQGVENKSFGICLDIGHVHAYSKQPIKEWIQNLGPYIKHMHMHDNHGMRDEHLALGKGTLDMAELFQVLEKYAEVQSFTIENAKVEEIVQSLEALRNYFGNN